MGKNRGISKYKVDGFHISNDGTINVHFSLHDAVILSDEIVDTKGKRLELRLDIDGSFSAYHTIVFNDYIVKRNTRVNDVWIINAGFKILDNGRYETVIFIEYFQKNKSIDEKLIINSRSVEFLSDECDGLIFPPQY